MSGLFHIFIQGLNITNAALATNYRSAAVREIFQRYEDRFGSGSVAVQIVGGDSDLWFRIRLQPGGFVILSHQRTLPSGPIHWQIQPDYLQELVDNSLHYMSHPEQLDWHWLYAKPEKPPVSPCEPEATSRKSP